MKIALLLLMWIATSCAYSVHQNYFSEFDLGKNPPAGKAITGEAEQFSILLNFSHYELVEKARANLEAQCPEGRITGINTRLLSAFGFFSWTDKIQMVGLCLPPKA